MRLPRAPLQLAPAVLLGATLVAMVLGSSWTTTVSERWSRPRWAILLLLCAASVWVARPAWRRLPAVAAPLLPLLGLALLSAGWSVNRHATLGRAGALALVFVVAAALATAVEVRTLAPAQVGGALVGAMGVVAAGGFALLAVSKTDAMHPGTGRLNGLGGDPNTVSSMLALGLPLALAAALRAGGRGRWLWSGLVALLVASVVASGSRGSLVAGAAGCALALLLVAGSRGRALRLLAVLAAVTAAATLAMTHPLGSTATHGPAPTGSTGQRCSGPGCRYINAELSLRLEDDVGASLPGEPGVNPHRSFLNSSGRVQAWRGALGQGADRPAAGYGFGTEALVFVDRYVAFQGAYVEDAYIGLFLQLGIAGLALFALAIVLAGRRVRARLADADPDARLIAAGFAGAVAAGLVLALTQSFVYAAGNVATLTFWVALLAAGAALRQRNASTSGVSAAAGVSP